MQIASLSKNEPLPKNEAERLTSLYQLQILDTLPEERFDRITRLALRLFNVPISLVSLVDVNRQWFKSCQGLARSETHRDFSFCAHAILGNGTLVIPDASADPRFADNPLVTSDPRIRFYAGHPIKGPGGYNLGTLCIIDRRPRQLSAADLSALQDMAAWAENELNILELRQTLAAGRKSEDLYRSVIASMTEGIVVQDKNGQIVDANASAEHILGLSADQMMGRTSFDPKWNCIHEDGSPFPPEIHPAVITLRTGIPSSGVIMGVNKSDGTLTWVSANAQPLFHQGETQPYAVVVSFADVTESRQAEEALRESEAQYRSLFQNSIDAVLLTAPDGRILAANPAACRIFGRSEAEISQVGRSGVIDVTDPRLAPALAERARTGSFKGELTFLHKDGTKFPGEITSVIFKDRYGNEKTSLIARDITERKRAAEVMQQNEAQLRAVLDATSEVITLVSPSGRFLTVNHRFEEIFGFSSQEVVGRKFQDVMPQIDQIFADVEKFYGLVGATAPDTEMEFTEIVAQRWPVQRELELFSAPVRTAAGLHLGRLYVFRDVTHQREVDRIKSEFISMISHELRTPLTSIKGYIDLFLDGEVGELTADQQEYLGIVKRNSDRLVALINELLDISRIEAGKVELNCGSIELVRLIQDVCISLTPQIEAKGQQLLLQFPGPADPPLPLVWADPDRCIQILTNLLSNAYKYTPGGGILTVAAYPAGEFVQIQVQDTGIGLSVEEKAEIFNKFFRAKNQATQAVGGTGLGLSITRSLVEMHGGTITVASTPGQGSTFAFTLPVAGKYLLSK